MNGKVVFPERCDVRVMDDTRDKVDRGPSRHGLHLPTLADPMVLLDELERRDLETGLATLCIGAGMGTATIIERV